MQGEQPLVVCRECGASHVCAPEKQKPKWKRILYEKQPYEDNHVDDSFLSSMVTNANVQAYDYLALSFDTLAIIQQVSAVVLFLIMFGHLWQGKLSAKYLVWVNVTLLFVGYATRVFLEEDVHMNQLMTLLQHISANIRQLFLFACILLGLSPVLKTLTFSFSSDTIYALTIVLYSMHLVLHDYSFVNLSNSKQVFSGSFSLNAAVFASVLLASRLPSSGHVFAIMLLAFEVFAGFPMVARSIKLYSDKAHIYFTSVVILITFFALLNALLTLAIVYALSVFFIAVISPLWLKWIQRYKNTIQGPWDYDSENEVVEN